MLIEACAFVDVTFCTIVLCVEPLRGSRVESDVSTLREGVEKKEYPICNKCNKQITK